jgi:cell division protein FtsI (penicillin-binding protein 3)
MTGTIDPGLAVARRRTGLLALAFVLALGGLAYRIVGLGLDAGAPRAASIPASIAPGVGRADIVDRSGVLLATDFPKPSIFADPALISAPDLVADRLAFVLQLDAGVLRARLNSDRRFVWIKRHVSEAERATVVRLGIPGVQIRTEHHRVYPQGRLTSHLVGFVGIENQGLAGLERSFDQRLKTPARRGEPLRTTLDVRVQGIVHEALERVYRRFQAKSAAAVVLEVPGGELRALVSLPDYDPNRYLEAAPGARFNRASQGTYELGSLFKLFTAAMALDAGTVRLTDGFDASEPFQIGRHRIGDFHAKLRWLSVPEVIAFSSNIGVARMAQALGVERQLGYFRRLGLLDPHPIRIPEVGRPQLPSPFRPINSITAAYGHGIAASPLQVADALAGVLCHGPWQRAHLVVEGRPAAVERPTPQPTTSAMLRWLMWLTVEEGTGGHAAVPGYLVGGKTGSADKPGVGGYAGGGLISSFIGAFPLEAPRFVVLVVLDQPTGTPETFGQAHGGWTAAPAVAEIIRRIGPLYGVRPARDEASAWFADRLQRGEAFNGRLHELETSLDVVPGMPWTEPPGGEGSCVCTTCSATS